MNRADNPAVKVKSSFFYGYIIVAVCFLLQALMFGPRGSFGVFVKPFNDEFGWSRALIAGAFSISSAVQGSSSILMGWLNDRFGPRKVLTLCGFLVGAGLMLMYLVHATWQLYIFYSIVLGFGMGGLYSPQMSTVARWFIKRRNIMTGILMAGGGLGGLIGPPLITWLVYGQGWRPAFLWVGAIVFVLLILGAQFLRRDPYEMGQFPLGESQDTEKNNQASSTGFSLKQVLRTRRFWMFAFMIFCFGFNNTTLLVHIVPHAIDRGIPATTAAVILSAMNGAMTAGSLIIGLVADKIGCRRVFLTCFCLLELVILLLSPVNSAWLLGIFIVVVAFGAGGIAVVESSMVAELFGMKSHGAILGTIVFTFAVGSALGPFIAGILFDVTGNYQWAFSFCGILIFLAIITGFILNQRRELAQNDSLH